MFKEGTGSINELKKTSTIMRLKQKESTKNQMCWPDRGIKQPTPKDYRFYVCKTTPSVTQGSLFLQISGELELFKSWYFSF